MKMIRILLLGLVIPVSGLSQVPVPSLQGRVTRLGTDEAVSKALVELKSADGPMSRTTTTVDDGGFVFHNLPEGSYELKITRPGYVPLTYGERRPGGPGTPLTLPLNPQMPLRLVMTPTGVITGRILDRTGQPVGNATIKAMKPSYTQDRRILGEVQSTYTDDRGEYRLFWLIPGDYYIGVTPTLESGRGVSSVGSGNADPVRGFRMRPEMTRAQPVPTDEYPMEIYFPGTFDPDSAATVEVGPGAEVRGIDIFAGPVRAVHVRGSVVDMTGQAVTGTIQIRVADGNSVRVTASRGTAPGTFDIFPMFPGSYFVSAGAGNVSGTVSLNVFDQDIDNVVIRVSSGFDVPGRIVVEGRTEANPGPALNDLRVGLRPRPSTGVTPAAAAVSEDGTFAVKSAFPGNYLVSVLPALQDAYVKSVRVGSVDVLNSGLRLVDPPSSPIEIVISTNAAMLEGKVVDDRMQPVPNATVALLPEEALRGRTDLYRNVTSDASGRFKLTALAPGNYLVFAWNEVDRNAWMNPEFIRRYEERGVRIQVAEGSAGNAEVRVIED